MEVLSTVVVGVAATGRKNACDPIFRVRRGDETYSTGFRLRNASVHVDVFVMGGGVFGLGKVYIFASLPQTIL